MRDEGWGMRDEVVARVLAKMSKRYPSAFALNPKERWRAYVETTIDILEVAQERASIERFGTVCELLRRGFVVASKSPADELLDVQSWVEFGFRILCASPKATDWSVTDHDDSAITHEEKERMLERLFPLFRAMLGWANKIPKPEGANGGSLDILSFEVLKHIKTSDANYWESAMRRKIFATDPVTGLSQYDTTFFKRFLHSEHRFSEETEIPPPPPLSEEKLMTRILCDLSNSRLRNEQHKFFYDKETALDAKIKSERKKWKVESFDLAGLVAAVKDALSDNPTGKGLTIKMYGDLQTLVSHDWMASVSSEDACSTSKRVIFTREEHDQFFELISALKEGFKNRAQKAETKEAADDWLNAAEMVSSTLRRTALGEKEWGLIYSLIANRRAGSLGKLYPLNVLTKGTAEYKTLHKTLDDQIAKIAEILPPKPCYMREYLDFLVGIRDGTLDPDEMTRIAVCKNHGLVASQSDADQAFRELQFNVEFYNQRLRFVCDQFEEAGRRGGKDLLGRYELIQADGIANGLYVFCPNVFGKLLFHNAYALYLFHDYGYADKLPVILQQVDAEWVRFFNTVIVAAAGKASFVAARNAYTPLRDQLQLQFGVIGLKYENREKRLKLYETFREKLNDLAMTVFECDSQWAQTAAPQPVAVASSTPQEAKGDDGQTDDKNTKDPDVLTIQRPDCPHATLNLKMRTVKIQTRRNKVETFVVPVEYDNAWKIIKLLFQETDADGYYEFKEGPNHYLHDSLMQQFCHKKRNEDMCELWRYIHSSKGAGKRGATRIRLEDHPRAKKARKSVAAKKKSKVASSGKA